MTSPARICTLSAGLTGLTAVMRRPPAAGDLFDTVMPKCSRARRPSLSRASSTARRGFGGRKLMVTSFTVPVSAIASADSGATVTTTSPVNVVWMASSPPPQKRVCRPSVKIIEILSVPIWAFSTLIS